MLRDTGAGRLSASRRGGADLRPDLGPWHTRAALTRLVLIGFAAFGLVYLRLQLDHARIPHESVTIRRPSLQTRCVNGGMQRGPASWLGETRRSDAAEPRTCRLERLERLAGAARAGRPQRQGVRGQKTACSPGATERRLTARRE